MTVASPLLSAEIVPSALTETWPLLLAKLYAPALPSLRDAVSVNWSPSPMVTSFRFSETDSGAGSTVIALVDFLPLWEVTVIFAVPAASAVSCAPSMAATDGLSMLKI